MSPQACVHGDMYHRASKFKALAPAECGVLWSSGGSVKAFWMLHALDSGQKEWLLGVWWPAGRGSVRHEKPSLGNQLGPWPGSGRLEAAQQGWGRCWGCGDEWLEAQQEQSRSGKYR